MSVMAAVAAISGTSGQRSQEEEEDRRVRCRRRLRQATAGRRLDKAVVLPRVPLQVPPRYHPGK